MALSNFTSKFDEIWTLCETFSSYWDLINLSNQMTNSKSLDSIDTIGAATVLHSNWCHYNLKMWKDNASERMKLIFREYYSCLFVSSCRITAIGWTKDYSLLAILVSIDAKSFLSGYCWRCHLSSHVLTNSRIVGFSNEIEKNYSVACCYLTQELDTKVVYPSLS